MADDLAVLYTDKKVQTLEKKLKKVYKQAEKDIDAKLKTFTEKSAAKEKAYLQKVANGTMSQEAFDHWKQGQVFYGENWKAQQKSIAKVLSNANSVANEMINGEKADVFAFAGNYTAYDMEHGFNANFGFDLYSEKSVERLVRDNPKILPKPKVNIPKDERWNMQNIRSQVTQGIIQGESIPKIAKRLSENVTNRNAKQMTMHARTAMTSAQNGGRQERYKEAQALGIKFHKVWLATLDSRTRDTHQDLDGQAVLPDEYFQIGKEKILFPGDPNAEPALVYNCRCTLITKLDDYPAEYKRRAKNEAGDGYDIVPGDMTYNEWAAAKVKTGNVQPAGKTQTAEPAKPKPALSELTKIKATMSEEDYKEFYGLVNGNEYVHDIYENYAGDVAVTKISNSGYYNKYGGVHYSMEKDEKFDTLAHEFGHAFDDRARDAFNVSYGEIDLLNDRCKIGSGRKNMFERVPSSSDEYLTALRKDREIIRNAVLDADTRYKWNHDNASAGLQDLADGLFATQDSRDHHLRWGHGNSYYNRKYNRDVKMFDKQKDLQDAYKELGFDASNQNKVKNITRNYETASELWANQMSALTTGGKSLEYMEQYAPNTLGVLKKLLKGVS